MARKIVRNGMSKTIKFGGALLTLSESKAVCPHCDRIISFDEIEEKFMRQDEAYIRIRCKCNRAVGITSNIQGDYVAYEL